MSSYEKNNYAEVFRSIILAWRPMRAVELGVLHGYSTLAIGSALKHLWEWYGGEPTLSAYDLFEDYEFKHGRQEEVQKRINDAGLDDIIALHKADAYQVHKDFEDGSVSLLHVDISNTGETLKKIIELWHPKLCSGGILLFEGGSEERDLEDWMITHDKPPILPELESNRLIQENYIYGTYLKWPSLTMLLKRG